MTTATPSRHDPVHTDDGCHLHNHCLTCPLPRCFYDEPAYLTKERARETAERNRKIAAAAESTGKTLTQLTEQFGVSRRTVSRALASVRKAG